MSKRLTQSEIQKYVILKDDHLILNLPLFTPMHVAGVRVNIDPSIVQRFISSAQILFHDNGLHTTVETTQFVFF
jgi:hypothetical protein